MRVFLWFKCRRKLIRMPPYNKTYANKFVSTYRTDGFIYFALLSNRLINHFFKFTLFKHFQRNITAAN